MCCAPNTLHILLTAQLATKKSLVPEGLLKHAKFIFSIPKVCVLTEPRVQPVWQQLSRERSRKEAIGDEISPHGRRLLLGISTHLFSLSHCDCLCFYQIFSLLLKLRDQMAPTHNALNHGKARGICYVLQQTHALDQVKLFHSQHMVRAAYGWYYSRYLYIHTLRRLEYLFFLQVVRKMTVIPSTQIARNGGSAVTHGTGQMLGTSREAQCLMARNPDGPRTGGSRSPSDFPLQLVIKLVLTPCPLPICTADSRGHYFCHEAPTEKEINSLFESIFASGIFKTENKPNFLLT